MFSSIAGFFGAGNQKKAAGQAAAAQTAAAGRGINAITTQNAQTQQQFSPYLDAGSQATSAIAQLLGLGGISPGGAQAFDPYAELLKQRPDVLAEYQQEASRDAKSVANLANLGINSATDYAKWWATNNNIPLPEAPIAPGSGASPQDQQASAIQALKDSPLFASLFGTGEEAILSNAAATGGLRGGNTQRSLADFGSDTLAKVIQQQLANLGGLSSQGLNAATNAGGLGAQAAGSVANLFGDQGAAQAGGILGRANATNAQLGHLANGVEAAIGSFAGAPAGASTGSKIASMFF